MLVQQEAANATTARWCVRRRSSSTLRGPQGVRHGELQPPPGKPYYGLPSVLAARAVGATI